MLDGVYLSLLFAIISIMYVVLSFNVPAGNVRSVSLIFFIIKSNDVSLVLLMCASYLIQSPSAFFDFIHSSTFATVASIVVSLSFGLVNIACVGAVLGTTVIISLKSVM